MSEDRLQQGLLSGAASLGGDQMAAIYGQSLRQVHSGQCGEGARDDGQGDLEQPGRSRQAERGVHYGEGRGEAGNLITNWTPTT